MNPQVRQKTDSHLESLSLDSRVLESAALAQIDTPFAGPWNRAQASLVRKYPLSRLP